MKRSFLYALLGLLITSGTNASLESSFRNPGKEAGVWAYWWWPSGYATKEGLVRELDEMRTKGITGALILHGISGPTAGHFPFMSDRWRDNFRFAVEEAAKRDISITVNLCEGWNAGGPWISQAHAPLYMQHALLRVEGPAEVHRALPALPHTACRKELFVLAWNEQGGCCRPESLIDLTERVDGDGQLHWMVPEGHWVIVRFGTFIKSQGYIRYGNHAQWDTARYFQVNELSAEGMRIHFEHTAKVLIRDVGKLAGPGRTFTHVHIDSGETGHPDWTGDFPEAFERRRGYDPRPYLAAKAGLKVDSDAVTQRFLEDYRRTQGDLIEERYYGALADLASQYGLGTHSEAAGYQKPTVDSLHALGLNDIVMSEFWSRRGQGYIHQAAQAQLRYHDGVRNAAAAAHIYGRRIVQAEAFTFTGHMNFSTPPYELKDIGDRAFCQGLNRNVLCFLMHQPECDRAVPGHTWPYVGMTFTVNDTWWPRSKAWFDYLRRCQAMLQAGAFVADVCYFQGEWIPSYVPAKWAMNPSLPQGYDCDVVNAPVLMEKGRVGPQGRLTFGSGISYRYLVLNQAGMWQMPPREIFGTGALDNPALTVWPNEAGGNPLALSPSTLRLLRELVKQGMTLVGPPPIRAIGLSGYPGSDARISALAKDLWGEVAAPRGLRNVGEGRVIWGEGLQSIMARDGLLPDLEYLEDERTSALPLPIETESGMPDPCGFGWVHRRTEEADLYFVANLRNTEAGARFTFRQKGCAPELWDPLTGAMRDLPNFELTPDNRIAIPLEFAPRQSWFVVFREGRSPMNEKREANFLLLRWVYEFAEPWLVTFDPVRGGPEDVLFPELVDWKDHPDMRIRHYSGAATYRTSFDVPEEWLEQGVQMWLDVGRAEVMAQVAVNGQACGTLWTAPWRVDITDRVQPGPNNLEIEVVNLWKNRLLADAKVQETQRVTKTDTIPEPKEKPASSGLLGPVRVGIAQPAQTTDGEKMVPGTRFEP